MQLLAALPALAVAQTIRGTAVERTGSEPVAGVVMLLLDTAGQVRSRALTNERGEYRLAASAPGTYRVRTLRIGYRPLVSLPFELQLGQELPQTLVLTNVPLALDTVRVVARSACRLLSDSVGAPAAVWEQVRIALTAAQITAGARVLKATIVRFQRAVDASSKRTLRESAFADTAYVSKPWRSRSTDSLRRFGYTHEEADGSRTYHAPDLDVLLSPEFIEDHCFRLADARNARELIGIAFEPTRERSRVSGIRGTLWLDRVTAILKRLEFSYVNTGAQGIDDAGGDMEFERMGNGAWAISGWSIRMPQLERRVIPSGGVPGAVSTTELRVREWQTAGGELVLVTQRGDTLWSRPTRFALTSARPAPPPSDVRPAAAPRVSRDTAVSLRPVEIRTTPMPTEFEERRLSGLGHYLTRADLSKQEARALPDILLQLPGVRIARDGGRSHVTSGRGVVTSLNEKRPVGRFESDPKRACYADVYMDGLLMYGGKKDETFFDIGNVRPSIIEGIEFYASPAQTPVKYSRPGAACGTLLIWTRRQ